MLRTLAMASKRPPLTPEQIALSEARKAKRLKQEQASLPPQDLGKGNILPRPWLKLQDPPNVGANRVKIFTWNVCVFSNSPYIRIDIV
jgi:RNA exonuclease NGL2